MIIWLASYPKSGNTWLRLFLQSLIFNEETLDINNIKIPQFPQKFHFDGLVNNFDNLEEVTKQYINAQIKINSDKKIKFFKTHSAYWKAYNTRFTDEENTLGIIHIVRDPRNVITSLKNHYELNTEQALKWMQNENNYIYDVHRFKQDGYSDFQFISSWITNYKSWKVQKKIPIKIIKYEELLGETFIVFKDVIEFINKTSGNKEKINKDKLKNAVNSTLFDKLEQ